jgi:predicted transglutaminase-like cysteine proteinase
LTSATIVAAPDDQAAANCAARITPATSPIAPAAALLVPDNVILGAMSVVIKHTPFDLEWAAVSAKQGSRKMQRALAATGARNSGDQAAQVEAINRWVNRKIEYGEDRDVYGRPDYWAPASETLRRGIGDCEDFAIAKMELLSALGISRDKMRLVVARDLVRNADHAVLVVSLVDGAVMLDNATDHLLDARLPNDYRPIMSFSQNAKWVHGYAIQPAPPIRMAVLDSLPQPAVRELLDVQTVTREPDMPTISLALLSVPLALPTSL